MYYSIPVKTFSAIPMDASQRITANMKLKELPELNGKDFTIYENVLMLILYPTDNTTKDEVKTK